MNSLKDTDMDLACISICIVVSHRNEKSEGGGGRPANLTFVRLPPSRQNIGSSIWREHSNIVLLPRGLTRLLDVRSLFFHHLSLPAIFAPAIREHQSNNNTAGTASATSTSRYLNLAPP